MGGLELLGVSVRYSDRPVLEGLDLSIDAGDRVVLYPSDAVGDGVSIKER